LGNVCARAFSDGHLQQIEWPGLGLFVFSAGSREVTVWPERGAKHEVIFETFSRLLQPVILQALGWVALHASAVLGPAGLLAFCGRSGSGKSTLAFALQRLGCWQIADDALVLRLDHDQVMVCPLPFTPRLRPNSRAHFAQAGRYLPPAAERQSNDVPLTAMFLLRQNVNLTSPRISQLPKARAFSELLAHAHCFDIENPVHTNRLADDYLKLSARVPVCTLEYQPDFSSLSTVTCALMRAANRLVACDDSRPRVAVS
jgi:hypothetical protein